MTSSRRTFWWFVLLAVLPHLCLAATSFYVKPIATGNGRGGDRDNCMSIANFRDGSKTGMTNPELVTFANNDVALLQPGTTYDPGGTYGFVFNGPGATRKGGTGDHLIYRADPVTSIPRSTDWWSRETKLEEPDPTKHVVFGRMTFNPYYTGSYNSANSYNITLDGLWLKDGYVFFYISVADVNIVNCNIFSHTTNKDITTDETPILYMYYGAGSDYHDIEVENCYLYGGKTAIKMAGNMRGGNTVTNCHSYCNGSGPYYSPASTVVGDPVIFRHCNFQYQVMIGEYNDPGVLTHTITAVDPLYPRRKFTIDSVAYPAQFVDVNDVSNPGTLEYENVVAGTSVNIELAADLDFDIAVGDKARFTDSIHGSGISLRGGDVTFDGCTLWEMGASRAIYFYIDVKVIMHNVHFLNCLVYDSLNIYTVDMADRSSSYVGNGLWFINNTIVGNRYHWSNQYDNLHQAYYRYGHAIEFGFHPTTDRSTARIINNLFIGQVSGMDMGTAIRRNNTLYFSTTPSAWSSSTTEPNDANNVTVYQGEPYGSEPAPFDREGTYFVAANADFNDVFTTLWLTDNLYGDFMLKEGSPAIDAGDDDYAPTTDIHGWLRTAIPDRGAWEYGSTNPLAPTAATNPSPADGALNVSVTKDLSWTAGDNDPTHHVFLGTDEDDVANGTGGTSKGIQAGTTYDTGTLDYVTHYYWRIEEGNADGNVPGDVWDFTTRVQPTPRYYLLGRKKP